MATEPRNVGGRPPGADGRRSRQALRGLAAVVLVAALALVAAPVGTWFEVDVGPFGSVTASGLGEVRAIDQEGGVESDAGAGGPDWAIGQIPDGLLSSALGIVLIGLAATWLARSVDRTQAVSPRRAGAVAAMLGAAALAWVVWSWLRTARTIDRQRAALGPLDPLSKLVIDQVHLEPGLGLLVAGAASSIIAVAGLRAVVRGSATSPAPPVLAIPNA